MDVNFEYYKVFYYVAKYGNITKAAAVLGSNQPNVTRVIKLLESQLSCRLLIREARGISLTEEGKRLYSHVEIACRHLFGAQEEICGEPAVRGGIVKIGATETALHLCLLDVLCDLKKEYPAIKIRIHNHATPEIVRQLASGKLDFAIATGPFEVPKTLYSEKILDYREILAGGCEYRELSDMVFELKDIRKYPWIGLGEGTATYEMYRNFFIEHKIDMELDMEVATSDLILPLIESNLGIGFIPEKLAYPLLREQRLVRIRLKQDTPKRSIQIISDKGQGKSAAADIFYKYLKRWKPDRKGYNDNNLSDKPGEKSV